MIDFSSNGGQWVLRDNLYAQPPYIDRILLPYHYTERVIGIKLTPKYPYQKIGWITQLVSIDPIGGVDTKARSRRLINGKQLLYFPVLTDHYRLSLYIYEYIATNISVWEYTPNIPFSELDLLELLAIS